MFRRPTVRSRKPPEEIILNLIPMLDALVTLIAFLLFTMTFLAIVSIESPAPVASTEIQEQQIKERPVQLTLSFHEEDVEIWSPFDKFPAKKIPNTPDGAPDLQAIHQALIEVKAQFPTETKAILVPLPSVNYDTLVATMDITRLMEKTDAPIYVKDPKTGVDQMVKTLFPDIVFGNLLGD